MDPSFSFIQHVLLNIIHKNFRTSFIFLKKRKDKLKVNDIHVDFYRFKYNLLSVSFSFLEPNPMLWLFLINYWIRLWTEPYNLLCFFSTLTRFDLHHDPHVPCRVLPRQREGSSCLYQHSHGGVRAVRGQRGGRNLRLVPVWRRMEVRKTAISKRKNYLKIIVCCSQD